MSFPPPRGKKFPDRTPFRRKVSGRHDSRLPGLSYIKAAVTFPVYGSLSFPDIQFCFLDTNSGSGSSSSVSSYF